LKKGQREKFFLPMEKIRPPYFAVLFFSTLKKDAAGYQEAAARMLEKVQKQEGFLGMDSVRGADGRGITISYWRSGEAFHAWGQDAEHLEAQRRAREWYADYRLEISEVKESRP
jgi:heme-degrading monooxygenase HmoA